MFELMNNVLSDRSKLQKRMLSAIDAVKSEAGVDNSKIASIGFCFAHVPQDLFQE